jgi:hypothetical protein
MTSTSSHPRLNKEVYLGSAHSSDVERLFTSLEAAKVQCVIDLRSARSQSEIAMIELGARSRRMHYAYLPELSEGQSENRGQPGRALAWAARTALRYRTCLLTEDRPTKQTGAREVAALVGLQLTRLPDGRRSP